MVKSFWTVTVLASFAAISGVAIAQAPAAQTATQVPSIPRAAFIETMDLEFKRIDADKNGNLTKKEIEDYQRAISVLGAQRRNQALFQALDKDKNGQLTAAEFAGLPMNMQQPNAAPIFGQTDANRDGQITAVEYRAGKLRNFDNMDADKDGIVTPAEMKAAGLIK